jgi:hypothetical protein
MSKYRKVLAIISVLMVGLFTWKAVQDGDWSYMILGAVVMIPWAYLLASHFTAQENSVDS